MNSFILRKWTTHYPFTDPITPFETALGADPKVFEWLDENCFSYSVVRTESYEDYDEEEVLTREALYHQYHGPEFMLPRGEYTYNYILVLDCPRVAVLFRLRFSTFPVYLGPVI